MGEDRRCVGGGKGQCSGNGGEATQAKITALEVQLAALQSQVCASNALAQDGGSGARPGAAGPVRTRRSWAALQLKWTAWSRNCRRRGRLRTTARGGGGAQGAGATRR